MQVILNYLKENNKFSTILIISLAVCTLGCVAVWLIRKFRFKKLNETQNNAQTKNISVQELSQEQNQNTTEDHKNAIQNCEETQQNNSSLNEENQMQGEENLDKTLNHTTLQENVELNQESAEPNFDTLVVEKQEESEIKNSSNNEIPTDKKQSEPIKNEQETVRYAGKWVIYKEDGRFLADLKASNGEKMLSTESYTSLSGIKSGIDTLKKNIANENYAINLDKNGNYVFKIFSTANRLLCVGEGYSTKEQCEKAFASVKRFSKTATITQQLD